MTTPPRIPGRLMGIDHGLKRIGLAVSDPSGLVARELAIIQRSSRMEDFEKILAHAEAQEVVGFVVGVPANPDALPGARNHAASVLRWLDHFKKTTTLPSIRWDETLSSQDAQALARRAKRRYDAPIDDLAARIILQSYLDALHEGLAEPPVLDDTGTSG